MGMKVGQNLVNKNAVVGIDRAKMQQNQGRPSVYNQPISPQSVNPQ